MRTVKEPRPGYLLRMPPDLKLALILEAARNGRSLNAEIVWRLEQSLTGYRR